MSYTNNGPKSGTKAYLVVGGKRIYTGQSFEASDSDVEKLEVSYNIGGTVKKAVAKPTPIAKSKPKKKESKKSKTTSKAKSTSKRSTDYFGNKLDKDKGVK